MLKQEDILRASASQCQCQYLQRSAEEAATCDSLTARADLIGAVKGNSAGPST
ncbi:GL22931 [Drosophila persimilis]|uniref:GL22931 n=1 Tax=Drosophila persimilis TaxID=7234 RepID=B4HCQ6_DROPE|nr:GL22931 [Drosophila persimilis]